MRQRGHVLIVVSIVGLISGGCGGAQGSLASMTPVVPERTIAAFSTPVAPTEMPATPSPAPTSDATVGTSIAPTGTLVAPAGTPLAFTAIVVGAASGGSGGTPSVLVVHTDAQQEVLAARLSGVDRPALETADLSTDVIIGAFEEVRPTSGYHIEILAVAIVGDALEVTVRRSAPPAGELVRQGFETPYHLVRVARAPFDAQRPTHYRLRDEEGAILNSTQPVAPSSRGWPPMQLRSSCQPYSWPRSLV